MVEVMHQPHTGAPTPELERLLKVLGDFARQQLDKAGGFEPFGASIRTNGEVVLAAAALTDSSDPMGLLMAVYNGLREEAQQGSLQAAGYCMNVNITPPGHSAKVPAIQVCLEDQLGHSIEVFYPYRLSNGRQPSYGPPFSGPDDLRIFHTPAGAA